MNILVAVYNSISLQSRNKYLLIVLAARCRQITPALNLR